MRILTRYVLREYLIPLFYCLCGFISIYVLFELFGSFTRMADAHVPVLTAIEYMLAYLAPYFEWLAPAALMMAALYTMWSFCRHSEIVAMRANGIGFVTIVKPILLTAVAMACLVGWVNEWYVPRRAQWAQRMKASKFDLAKCEKADDIVFRNAVARRIWTVDALEDGEARHLRGVRVTVDRPGGMRLMNVTAARADYLDGEWWFEKPAVQHYDEKGNETASKTPELDALKLRVFPEFRERPEDFLALNRSWAYNSIRDRLRYLRTHADLPREISRRLRYDVWAKIFAPLACLVITLLAIPAGVASGRQSVFKGILGAIGLFFSFYGLTIGCLVAADKGWLPPVFSAALPHVVFLALGFRAFVKNR